jgi:TRAP-type mannitol/chloroaromatic compound transport system permease small subunit
MRGLRQFMRIVTRFNNWVGAWFSYAVFLLTVLLLADVFMRYLIGRPAIWTAESAQLLFGAYAVLSGGYLMAQGAHVNVDIFYARFSPRTKAAVDVFTSVLTFLFVGALVYFGSAMAWESVQRWETSASAWNPPIWPIRLAIPVGATLLLLQAIVKLIQDILTLQGIEPEVHVERAHRPEDSL